MISRPVAAISLLISGILTTIMIAFFISFIVGARYAESLDHTWPGPGLGGTYCPPTHIHPALHAPRAIQQDESSLVTLVVDVDPLSESETAPDQCKLNIELLAPKFELTPAATATTVSVVRGQSYIGRWVFAPKDIGTYHLAFMVNTCFGIIGISVLNGIGLPAKLVVLLSLIPSALLAGLPKLPSWVAEQIKNLRDWRKRRAKLHMDPPTPENYQGGTHPPG